MKFNRNVKQNPDLYKYSKEFNKNRDLFQGYVYDTDFIYSDENSIGYIEYIDEQYGETDITLSTSIKDKNLDTGEITQFKIEIPNSLKSENNNNHKGLVTKYNGEVYIALLGEQENNPDIKMGEKDELENFVRMLEKYKETLGRSKIILLNAANVCDQAMGSDDISKRHIAALLESLSHLDEGVLCVEEIIEQLRIKQQELIDIVES